MPHGPWTVNSNCARRDCSIAPHRDEPRIGQRHQIMPADRAFLLQLLDGPFPTVVSPAAICGLMLATPIVDSLRAHRRLCDAMQPLDSNRISYPPHILPACVVSFSARV